MKNYFQGMSYIGVTTVVDKKIICLPHFSLCCKTVNHVHLTKYYQFFIWALSANFIQREKINIYDKNINCKKDKI